MHDDSSKLRHQHQQEAGMRKQGATAPIEFAHAEELLRHDASKAGPPAAIIERLSRSLAAEPLPKQSWWRRLFSK